MIKLANLILIIFSIFTLSSFLCGVHVDYYKHLDDYYRDENFDYSPPVTIGDKRIIVADDGREFVLQEENSYNQLRESSVYQGYSIFKAYTNTMLLCEHGTHILAYLRHPPGDYLEKSVDKYKLTITKKKDFEHCTLYLLEFTWSDRIDRMSVKRGIWVDREKGEYCGGYAADLSCGILSDDHYEYVKWVYSELTDNMLGFYRYAQENYLDFLCEHDWVIRDFVNAMEKYDKARYDSYMSEMAALEDRRGKMIFRIWNQRLLNIYAVSAPSINQNQEVEPYLKKHMNPLTYRMDAEGNMLDYFGIPIRISVDETRVLVFSAGEDKVFGTDDDQQSVLRDRNVSIIDFEKTYMKQLQYNYLENVENIFMDF